MKTLRIFPRKTNGTPDDENVIINRMPHLYDEADQIHISVAFTWDIPRAEKLAYMWKSVAPVTVGGPAFNQPGGEFEPGMYLKEGCVITSRGCNNRCWFCSVWKREPVIKELKINEGWNIMDDNLIACSDQHIKSVFEMLKRQKHKARFTGGIEAKLLKEWHCKLFADLKPDYIYFAYDTPDDYEYLREASKLLLQYKIMQGHRCMCYVLIGYPNDTFEKALRRIQRAIKIGYMPFAMLYRDETGKTNIEWRRFQREYANPIITASNMKQFKEIKL